MKAIINLASMLKSHPAEQVRILTDFVESQTFPLIEPNRVTFFYWDEESIDGVQLQHWLYGLEVQQNMRRLADTDAFWCTIELPDTARMEYQYILVKNEQHTIITDPHNPKQSRSQRQIKSVCSLSEYQTPLWSIKHPKTPPGTLDEWEIFSNIFAETKSISVYLPNEYQKQKKYPLLICLDGQDYAEYGSFNFVLDNLMHQHEMMPTIVVQVNSPDRFKEFAANPMFSTFIHSELIPHIEARYRISPGSDNRGIMGVGLGAVAALHTQWRHPDYFGKLLLQSGAFVFTDIGDHGRGEEWDPIVDFINSLRETPNQSGTIYLSCGVFDSLIYYNRTIAHLWEPTNIKLRYVESKDGHNWIAWRDRLREGLTWLYPGHLRMIYD